MKTITKPISWVVALLIALVTIPSCKKLGRQSSNNQSAQEKSETPSPSHTPSTNKGETKARAQEVNDFDLKAWIKQYGQAFNLKDWKQYNPSPYRAYFSATGKAGKQKKAILYGSPRATPKQLKKSQKTTPPIMRWYDEIGPLGVTSFMHDRTWGIMPAVLPRFPKALRDKKGVAFNAIEVLKTKPHSPAKGHLKHGDLILEIDGQRLLPAQHMFLDHEVTSKLGKGLRIHVGKLIDRAEGRGEIQLKVVHLPDSLRNKISHGVRKSLEIKTVACPGKVTPFSVSLAGADTFIIHLKGNKKSLSNLVLKSDTGLETPLLPVEKHMTDLTETPLECPAGNWTLEGTLSHKTKALSIELLSQPSYPKSWQQYTRTETIKIPKLGSFGDTFDPTCNKAKNYAAVMAHRLAVQQHSDGSWNAYSYASPVFQTSICGLALLSLDDPKYDKAIKAAVDYICKKDRSDKWSYANAMPPIFLSEYYLRTKDSSVLPYLRLWLDRAHRCVLSDYTSGHGIGAPGYGGHGYIGAGGAIACGFAVASHTPAITEHDLFVLDHMLERAQEIAPNGPIPYGRIGKKDLTSNPKPEPGQRASCATGPYFQAARIRGGTELFIKNNTYRYSHGPYGSAEHGHATQTMHFFWGMLSSAVASDQAFIDNMSDHLWRYTLYRDYDGTANKNNERTEYHNADGVIGEPYWRMASFIIHMNAYKHNLAITGKPEYQSKGTPRKEPMVYHADKSLYNEILRNWSLAEYVLGDQAPTAFTQTFTKLRQLPKDSHLGDNTRSFLNKEALPAVQSILALKNFKGSIKQGQIASLLLGIYFDAICEPDFASGLKPQKNGKATKKVISKRQQSYRKHQWTPKSWLIKINRSKRIIGEAKGKAFKNQTQKHLFPISDLTVSIADPTHKHLRKVITRKVSPPSNKKARTSEEVLAALRENTITTIQLAKNQKAKIFVKISYRVADTPISYVTAMKIPVVSARGYIPTLTQVPVVGEPTQDYSKAYSIGIILDKTKRVIACEVAGNAQQQIPYLLQGGKYKCIISPRSSQWAHDLRAAIPHNPNVRNAKVISIEGLEQHQPSAEKVIQRLGDHRQADAPAIKAKSNQTLVFHLDKPQTIDKIYLAKPVSKSKKKNGFKLTFEAFVQGEWKFMAFCAQPGLSSCMPYKTDKIRVTIGKNKTPICELNFITNSKMKPLNKATW